jgi:hypothetical protein
MDKIDRMKYLKFQELVETKRVITLTPKYPPYDTSVGFALAVSEEMLLMQEIVEFHLSGYSITPIPEIRAVRSKKAERTLERIFEAEGLQKQVGIAEMPPLNDWPDLFRWLQKDAEGGKGKFVQVQFFDNVDPGFSDEACVYGKIIGLSARSVAVRNFTEKCEWESESTVISYENIKRIRWDTEYIKVFQKYLPKT